LKNKKTTTTIPAAAAQIISSPIKPSSPNSESVVGPRVFTDLENYQHATGFVRQPPITSSI
jgi:hypothetical protein